MNSLFGAVLQDELMFFFSCTLSFTRTFSLIFSAVALDNLSFFKLSCKTNTFFGTVLQDEQLSRKDELFFFSCNTHFCFDARS